jgi:tRNA nucleotidyltransferase (CCA-adding enzyme)
MENYYEIINKIINPAYLVGGSVRDELLGKQPKDFDYTTPMLPETIENNIKESGHRVYSIGKKFGTLGLKINNTFIEITTFRNEKYTDRNRKPLVEFVGDLTTDLSRRDFTINAMAKDSKQLYDPFNGKEDLENKIIRCVGKPSERFQEDSLRMLRAARFSAQLGFTVEKDTFEMCKQLNYKILNISKERWVMELDKLLTSQNPSLGLDFLMQTRLMNYILPELSLQYQYNQNNPYHTLDLWEHTKKVVELVPNDIELKWAALLHDIGKPFCRQKKTENHYTYYKHDLLGKEIVNKIALYLKWSNNRKENVMKIVLNHMMDNNPLRIADKQSK